jgi:hypothetical protein
MEPRLIGSYNLVLVYQEFLLLLIALMGTWPAWAPWPCSFSFGKNASPDFQVRPTTLVTEKRRMIQPGEGERRTVLGRQTTSGIAFLRLP